MIEILECPSNFNTEARKEYERIINIYTERKETDKLEPIQAILEMYCESVGTYRKAMAEVKKTSEVISQNGKPAENPWMAIAKKASDNISKYGGIFDLSADIKEIDIKVINGVVEYRTSRITKLLGVTQQAMSKWVKDGCPSNKHGWWDLEKVLAWRGLVGSNLKTAEDVAERSLMEQKLFYEVKLKQTQGEAQELKNKISNGDFLDRDIIVQELSRVFEILKRTLNTMTSQISLEVGIHVDIIVARKVDENLREVVRDYLQQMSEKFDYEPSIKRKRKR